jgi:hypothetical protein
MTEKSYYTTCLGFKRKKLNEAKVIRRTHWLILSSFADPKKLPANEMKWLPLEGDEFTTYIAPPKEVLQEWDKKFRSLKLK